MKKYILISLLFHLSLFIFLKSYKQLGNENFNKVVPITFVATTSSPNPGSPIVAPKEVEKKEEKKPEIKKEEKKIEIKSKIADKKEKKVEEKIQEKTEEKNLEQDQSKEDDTENTSEDGNTKEKTQNDGDNVFSGSNFMNDGDGGYVALSSAGINYEILNEVEPEYPSQAEMIGYSERVIVGVKFLVGLKGEILKVEITKSHAKLGFDDEVKKAIKKWRFKPIFHHGKNIKVYFEKDFIFNPR
ncbi:energy transducer TonB [Fusobacterium russii]|uniref:energy transducer TonB n=1 Tax=Fusobacterium russii TaxID=854 RepID=UPI0003AAFB52|nr:energy transducer TonB [Fusobacterium russii]